MLDSVDVRPLLGPVGARYVGWLRLAGPAQVIAASRRFDLATRLAVVLLMITSVITLALREPRYGVARVCIAMLAAVASIGAAVACQAIIARLELPFRERFLLVVGCAASVLAAPCAALLAQEPAVCRSECEAWMMHGYAAHLGNPVGMCVWCRRVLPLGGPGP